MEEKTNSFKVVIIGSSSVGKTCILFRLVKNIFENQLPTIEGQKFIYSNPDYNGSLDLWDTAGQEKYGFLSPFYYRDAQAAIIVYSIDNKDSFNSVDKLYSNLVNFNIKLAFLVENKIDLRGNSTDKLISEEEGKKKADELNIKFVSVSAQNGYGIRELFDLVLADCITSSENEMEKKIFPIPNPDQKKECC